jgi:HPt (histidine-containing phosphotransfer) domain-containing protein
LILTAAPVVQNRRLLMTSTATDFSDIPGLEMARALLMLPGHEAILARLLRQFVASYGTGLPEWTEWASAGRWDDLRRGLHGFKGACAAVGALDLAARCEPLESRLQALVDGVADDHDAAQVPPGIADLRAALLALAAAVGQRLAAQERETRATPGEPGRQ